MQRKNIFKIVVFAVMLAGLVACDLPWQPTEEEAPPPPIVQAQNDVVTAEAFVTPPQDVRLSFKIGGRVIEVLVEEGDIVEEGQVLARLDGDNLQAAVNQAEANLNRAQAELAETIAGATPEQIAQAEAAVALAEAQLARLVSGPTDEEVAVAEANLDVQRARFNQTIAATRSEELEAAAANLLQAQADLQQARAAFDQVSYSLSPNDPQPIPIALQQAQLAVEAAQARFDQLVNGPTAEVIAVAQAQVAESEAAVEQVEAGPTAEQIAQAQAGVLEAQAALSKILAGTTPEQIAISEAAVTRAEATLQKAQDALEDTVMRAPIAGTITDLTLEVGEYTEAGMPVITLANLTPWFVETDDLTEIDVVDVAPGQPVIVEIDALPDEEFTGTVNRIRPQSETKAGDVTYTVEIALDEPGASDPRLRWGLTSQVQIQVQ